MKGGRAGWGWMATKRGRVNRLRAFLPLLPYLPCMAHLPNPAHLPQLLL